MKIIGVNLYRCCPPNGCSPPIVTVDDDQYRSRLKVVLAFEEANICLIIGVCHFDVCVPSTDVWLVPPIFIISMPLINLFLTGFKFPTAA